MSDKPKSERTPRPDGAFRTGREQREFVEKTYSYRDRVRRETGSRITPKEAERRVKAERGSSDNIKNPIQNPVGPKGKNNPQDVMAVERALDRVGELDLAKTNGPTGFYGERTRQAIERLQRKRGLKADGLLNPNGPTEQSLLGPKSATRLQPKPQRKPTPPRRVSLLEDTQRHERALFNVEDAPLQSERWEGEKKKQKQRNLLVNMDDAGLFGKRWEKYTDKPTKALRDKTPLQSLSSVGRKIGLTNAADNLDRFLYGDGTDTTLTRDELFKSPIYKDAKRFAEENRQRIVSQTFTGTTDRNEAVNNTLNNLKDGETVRLSDDWDRKKSDKDTIIEALSGDLDAALARGRYAVTSKNNFKAKRTGDTIRIEGTVTHTMDDRYDFEEGRTGALVLGAQDLQRAGAGKPFTTSAKWKQKVKGTVKVLSDGSLGNPQFEWMDIGK